MMFPSNRVGIVIATKPVDFRKGHDGLAAFTYTPGRSGQYADDILKDFSGILQVDGYAGYNRRLIRTDDNVALAYCWDHARRKLHEVAQSGTAPIAEEGPKQIATLYRIEKDIRGLTAKARLAVRQDRSAPSR